MFVQIIIIKIAYKFIIPVAIYGKSHKRYINIRSIYTHIQLIMYNYIHCMHTVQVLTVMYTITGHVSTE